MDLFNDIDAFQKACDQESTKESYALYLKLIEEEFNELQDAVNENDKVEQLDALIDILVVTIGAIKVGGFDGRGAWTEVMKTNFAKIDAQTGKVRKRADGKILKPDGWVAPSLEKFCEGSNV